MPVGRGSRGPQAMNTPDPQGSEDWGQGGQFTSGPPAKASTCAHSHLASQSPTFKKVDMHLDFRIIIIIENKVSYCANSQDKNLSSYNLRKLMVHLIKAIKDYLKPTCF